MKKELNANVEAMVIDKNKKVLNIEDNIENADKVIVKFGSNEIILDIEKGLKGYSLKKKDKEKSNVGKVVGITKRKSLTGNIVSILDVDAIVLDNYSGDCINNITWRELGVTNEDEFHIVAEKGNIKAISRSNSINGAIGWINEDNLDLTPHEPRLMKRVDILEEQVEELLKGIEEEKQYLQLEDRIKRDKKYYTDYQTPDIKIETMFDENGQRVYGDDFLLDKQTKVMQDKIGDKSIILIKTNVANDDLYKILHNRNTFKLSLIRNVFDKNFIVLGEKTTVYEQMKLRREYSSRKFNDEFQYIETTYIFASDGIDKEDIKNIMDRDMKEEMSVESKLGIWCEAVENRIEVLQNALISHFNTILGK